MKRHNLILYVFLSLFTFSCAKENTQKLPATNKLADDGGYVGMGACWHSYFAAIKAHLENPSDDDYIPGQPELDLTTCLSTYLNNDDQPNQGKLYPPATPPDIIKVPVPGLTDNLYYAVFFGFNGSSTETDYDNARAIFQHYTDIVRAAFAAGYLQGTDQQAKISACIAYVVSTPGIFTSQAEQQQFYAYLQLVFPLDHTFTIDVRPNAIQTGLFTFNSFDYSPIGLSFTIGSI